jgi:hypothetical protein
MAHNCAMVSQVMGRINGNIQLPASGQVVVESHLVAAEDMGFNGTWPQNETDGIAQHLARACGVLISMGFKVQPGCTDVYNASYKQVWTPSEGGNVGQGSTNYKPPAECEMWEVNMYWNAASKPARGTKFLMQANGKSVVACAGYETGPSSSSYIAGAQPEVHYVLGTTNASRFTAVGMLVDQTLPFGPVTCQ